jgi:adenine-specific DNA-methyltransferase
MPKKASTQTSQKKVATLTHEEARRTNIPTAEYQAVMQKEEQNPIRVAYERRNRDLDPQLVWRGKDEQDWSDLVVHAPPLYIQEKVHPKVLIDDLLKQTREQREHEVGAQPDLFADFNGIPTGVDKTEFYRHEQNWSNRMILGDSLQVMASLAEREGLRGKVQCIYLDPPYGIKFNSNFQWSTTSTRMSDGNIDHITREPEQVKAFRDTWRDGVHSYLNYLRDRLTVARDLLAESGSIFVQIGDENVHTVRSLLEEVFGTENHCGTIQCQKTTGAGSPSVRTVVLASVVDYIIWYAKNADSVKYRQLFSEKELGEKGTTQYVHLRDFERELDRRLSKDELIMFSDESPRFKIFAADNLTSQSPSSTTQYDFQFQGGTFQPGRGYWKTTKQGLSRLGISNRLKPIGKSLMYRRFLDDFAVSPLNNLWQDVFFTGFTDVKLYVVQTSSEIIKRCISMTTDPGDLVLDPTCGSGTTAYVAEQWGRRWITIDTSRVALALARARIMGARYPYYLLADSRDGQLKEAEITDSAPSEAPTHGNLRQGFVYERVSHITLKSIANNAEIDVIWEQWQMKLEPLREALNKELHKSWQEWEIPREADARWSAQAKQLHTDWWQTRIARQKEIDASIAARAEFEYLYDRPYDDKRRVRVAGPFTVESLSPHRVLGVDEYDELIDGSAASRDGSSEERGFVPMILDHLKTAGVQQAHKEDKITFTSLTPSPGKLICAEGRYIEDNAESGN